MASRSRLGKLNPEFASENARERVDVSLAQKLRHARASGVLHLANLGLVGRLASTVFEVCESYCEDEKFWEICAVTKLDLCHNMLSSVEGDWWRLSELTVVRISHNRLRGRLPEGIGSLTSLQVLDVGDNCLIGLPSQFESRCLRCVHFARNRLLSPLSDMGRALEELDASGNSDLGRLPAASLQNVHKLEASGIGLNELPSPCCRLQTVNFARNCLVASVVERTLVNTCDQLIYVDLRENRLGPRLNLSSFRAAATLSHLFLGHNGLEIVTTHSVFRSLSTLDLGSNRLASLPDFVCADRTPELVNLDCSNNNLSNLPVALGSIRSLHRIKVHGNPLRAIRADIVTAGYEKLKEYLRTKAMASEKDMACCNSEKIPRPGVLDLSGGRAREYDAETALALPLVRIVDISASNLETLPQFLTVLGCSFCDLRAQYNHLEDLSKALTDLCQLPLQALNLSNNALRPGSHIWQLPTSAANLAQKLTDLNLSSNRLDSFPEILFNLGALTRLYMSSNRLRELGSGWQLLSNLELLDCKMNKLTHLGNVHEASNLRILDLSDNDIATLPPALGLAPRLGKLLLSGNPQRTFRASELPGETAKCLKRLRGKLPVSCTLDEPTLRTRPVLVATSNRRRKTPPPPDSPPPPNSPAAPDSPSPPASPPHPVSPTPPRGEQVQPPKTRFASPTSEISAMPLPALSRRDYLRTGTRAAVLEQQPQGHLRLCQPAV